MVVGSLAVTDEPADAAATDDAPIIANADVDSGMTPLEEEG